LPEQRGLFDDLHPDPADIRARHLGMLLLVRVTADSYAWMEEDHATVRRLGVPLSFPHAELEHVLHKVLRAGQRVAICDPPEPREAKR
jgi:hypothetical protein